MTLLFMKYWQAEEAVEVWQRSWSGVLGACFAGNYRGVVAAGLFSSHGLIIIAWHPATRRGHWPGYQSCLVYLDLLSLSLVV